jgi:hypothetical protein
MVSELKWVPLIPSGDKFIMLCSTENWEARMADPHQVNIIIATAICDARRDHSDQRMDPEEAKQIAKCIVEALADAGLKIVSADPT